MITMLLSKIRFLDAFICSLGKNADVIMQVIIFFGIHLAVDNGLELFKIIQKEPIGLSVYLMLIWYGLIICLVYYYFTLERTSSTARRLYGIAVLSSFGYILWTILSVLAFRFQLVFLSACVTLCLFGAFVSLDHNFRLSTSRFRLCGKILCALYQISILGFELYKILSGPFHLAYTLKCACHIIVVVLYGNHSYQLSLLLGVIGSLDVILRSVGKKAEPMQKLVRVVFGVSLVLPFIIEFEKRLKNNNNITEFEQGLKSGGLNDYLMAIGRIVGLVCVCYLGMLEDPIVNLRLRGAAFLYAFSYLQYADDTLIFLPQDDNTVLNYKRIMDCFAIMTGLQINFNKSTLVPWNTDTNWVHRMSNMMGCAVQKLPLKYLGMDIGGNPKRVKFWEPVLEKIEKRLAMWQSKLLSRSGRAQLIRSVLNNLPIYYLSMFKIPNTVAKKIIQLQRRFFWGGNNDHRTLATVNWELLEAPKYLGGLGFGNIQIKNLGLLLKWWTRLATNDSPLWKKVVYSVNNTRACFPSSDQVLQGPWSDIAEYCNTMPWMKACISNTFSVKIGDGRRTRFWSDRWVPNEQQTLKERFPRLFVISSQQLFHINDMRIWDGVLWSWDLQWKRMPHQWEVEMICQLQQLISLAQFSSNTVDTLTWSHSKDSQYTTKSFCDFVGAERYQRTLPVEVVNFIWNTKAPPRAKLTLWFLAKNKLKTGDYLARIGVIRADEATCPWCQIPDETSTHIFFECPFIWRLWCACLQWWNIQAVLHNNCVSNIFVWPCLVNGRFRKRVWNSVFMAIIWSIWFERNKIKFDNKTCSFQSLLQSVKIRSYEWLKGFEPSFPYSWWQFEQNVLLCTQWKKKCAALGRQ